MFRTNITRHAHPYVVRNKIIKWKLYASQNGRVDDDDDDDDEDGDNVDNHDNVFRLELESHISTNSEHGVLCPDTQGDLLPAEARSLLMMVPSLQPQKRA